MGTHTTHNSNRRSQNENHDDHRCFIDKPIRYYPALDESFDEWALNCGWDSQTLRQATEQAVRSRHHEATIEHESHGASGTQPDVFKLSLGSVEVIYTVEPFEVVIRGYGWEIDHEPVDDYDGGGFYCEPSWKPAK